MDWLRATHKYLLSFLKSDWQLEDYPVRVVSQEASTDAEAVPGWRAQIINWWLVGFGNTPAQALEDLRKNLEAARAEGPLPRPGNRPPVEFASSTQLERHGEFAYDFVDRVVGVRPMFMSDGTTLGDFCGDEELEQVHRKIALLFGVDSREMTHDPLWRILDATRSKGGAAEQADEA